VYHWQDEGVLELQAPADPQAHAQTDAQAHPSHAQTFAEADAEADTSDAETIAEADAEADTTDAKADARADAATAVRVQHHHSQVRDRPGPICADKRRM